MSMENMILAASCMGIMKQHVCMLLKSPRLARRSEYVFFAFCGFCVVSSFSCPTLSLKKKRTLFSFPFPIINSSSSNMSLQATLGLLATCIPLVLADDAVHTQTISSVWPWIFLVGIIVLFSVCITLLCCTRQRIALPLDDEFTAEFDEWPLEREEDLATLSEDAALSYTRAKGNVSFFGTADIEYTQKAHLRFLSMA